MNDPQVVALFYTIENGPSVDYREAKPRDYEEKEFSIHVEDKKVRFTMRVHYATQEEAQEAVRGYIEQWEFAVGLERGPNTFRLKFDRAEIKDGKPSVRISSPAPEIRIRGTSPVQYPDPPSALDITPDVQSMFDRFMGYRSGREPLPSMAYFCLTVLEQSTGARGQRRRAAAKQYGIDFAVLDKIGSLSSGAGGQQARKASGVGRELTSAETYFLKRAMAALIHRAAEVAHDSNKSHDEIKLSDLPELV